MLRPGGEITIASPFAPTITIDTFTCAHCQRIVRVPPRANPSDMGGWCASCAKCVCGPCSNHGCTPWEKRMEHMEARDRFLRAAGLCLVLVVATLSTLGAQFRAGSAVRPPRNTANTTVGGTLTLASTFDAISVSATYTGDANADNSASLLYRVNGSGTWLPAYTPAVDRRATVADGTSNTPNRYQVRGSIVGLTAGVTYEVALTLNDPDGVTGGLLTGTTTLLSAATVVRSGSTYYLDDVGVNGSGSIGSPFNSFSNALAATACGDKLIVKPGTYAAFTFSKTCSASTWYVIEGETRDATFISDGGTQNLSIDGNFVQIANVRFSPSANSTIIVQANRHDLWLDNIYIEDVAAGTSGGGANCPAHYNDAGVLFAGDGQYHVYVLNSTFLGGTLTANCDLGTNQPGAGIYIDTLSATGGMVFKGNTFNGGFRDAIGNSPESYSANFNDSDVANNTFIGFKDDGIQLETKDINARVWGNTITLNVGAACFAAETGFVGPIYYFRNYCAITTTVNGGGTAWKIGGLQVAYMFHNTISAPSTGATDGLAAGNGTSYITAANNIFVVTGNAVYQMLSTGSAFDYNTYYRPGGGNLIRLWDLLTNYTTVGAFCSAQLQECHGVGGDPSLDGSGHIASSSNAYDVGVILNNFNDGFSAWPFTHAAPDIGFYEVP